MDCGLCENDGYTTCLFAISGLSLLLVVSFLAPRCFSLSSPGFPSPQTDHFQIPIRPGIR